MNARNSGEKCDTIFYQGNGSSQAQCLNYIGNQKIIATTGECMWSVGRNNLPPLNVIYRLHIGAEIADVNLHPFDSYFSIFNPIKVVGSLVTWGMNRYAGYRFSASTNSNDESVVFHAPILSQVSIGQETDIRSHRKKYDTWLEKEDRTNGLILWGVSRGTAATFCAFAKEKYPEVKLVVLEGAIDSVQEVLPKRVSHVFKSEYVSQHVTRAINAGFRFFKRWNIMQYQTDGLSPLKSVADFPEGVPVVFITSKADTVVPCSNTENIAQALADKGKNDVYLLKLEHSSHSGYMFDNAEDHHLYNDFMQAIFDKYNLECDSESAEKGESLIGAYTLYEAPKESYLKKVF